MRNPGVKVEAPPLSESVQSETQTNRAGQNKVLGDDSEERRSPRWTVGSLSGSYYRWSDPE